MMGIADLDLEYDDEDVERVALLYVRKAAIKAMLDGVSSIQARREFETGVRIGIKARIFTRR